MSTEVALSEVIHKDETKEDDTTDESSAKAPNALDEAIKELMEEPPFNSDVTDHKFKLGRVNAVRRAFEFILIWFSILLLAWDIVIPIASIKTAFWEPSDQVTCEDPYCTPDCMKYGTAGYDPECKPKCRPYGDTKLFFNPQFRQEFGVYWIVLISFHVGAAWISFPSYILQLFFTERGRRFHKFFGIMILFFVMVLWSFGGVAAAIMVGARGFHPCAYVIEGYNNPNSYFQGYENLRKQSSASSFSFFLYLQFAYDGALLNECLMHGIAARLLAGMSFDPKYPFVKESRGILKKWQAHLLGMLFL